MGRDAGFSGNGPPGWSYDDTQMAFDYNLVFSVLTNGNRINWRGQIYPDAQAFNAATSFKHNLKERPKFVNESNYDFSLAADDTSAKDHGANLEGLNLPGLEYDLAGQRRGADGAWDLGALELTGQKSLKPGAPDKLSIKKGT